MKKQIQYYKYYQKLMKMSLSQSVVKTSEYHILFESYPRIAESIRLKRQNKRLKNQLKTEKSNSVKIKIKRQMSIVQMQIKKNSLFKRLYGESKREAFFKRKMKKGLEKKLFSKLSKKYQSSLGKSIKNTRKKIRNNLPPSVLLLKELDVTEKGLLLSEWIKQKKRKN